jgi:formylmethanofuran dehydrogenase subunit E
MRPVSSPLHEFIVFKRAAVILAFASLALTARPAATVAEDADWWAPEWLIKSAYTPTFAVKDTANKYGRYVEKTKTVSLGDLIKYHGHFCGGLVESAGALRVAFDILFPDNIIDRTDLRIASNNSACGGDVAAYLTGARSRFGSHIIDTRLAESEFVVQRVSTEKLVRVRVRPEVYPTEVRAQMRKLESGNFKPEDIDLFQELQWDYAKRIISRPLGETFVLLDGAKYQWPEPSCKDLGSRKDNAFKAAPAR